LAEVASGCGDGVGLTLMTGVTLGGPWRQSKKNSCREYLLLIVKKKEYATVA
jgi:hypothetical protein